MTGQFAVSTVTAGSETRGIGHDYTGTLGLTEVKQRARASWAAGDFPAVAKLQLWVVGNGWYAGWGSAGTRTSWCRNGYSCAPAGRPAARADAMHDPQMPAHEAPVTDDR
jgi:hypothetical protein